MYNRGFVFTRPEEGAMQQTRSMRVDLSEFELSSENRRILRKTARAEMGYWPLPCTVYTWKVGKMGKDFYDAKFGEGTFSANKVKELMTGGRKDFNGVFVYKDAEDEDRRWLGVAICVETDELIHYSYPFYDLELAPKNMGMGMMLKALVYAKEQGKKYMYLGSAQRPTDTYKLQFKGIEWFDGNVWNDDLESLKQEL